MVERGLGHDGRMPWLRLIGSALVVVVVATVVSACDRGADAPVEEPRTRLLALRDLWFASPGHDHVPHDRTRPWRGNISASVSAPARRGRCPDRLEDLLGRRRDATRVGPARPMAHGRGPRTEASHCSLPQMATFVVVGPRLQRPPVSPPRRADRSRRWSKPPNASSPSSALPADRWCPQDQGGRSRVSLPSASVRSEVRRRRLTDWSGASPGRTLALSLRWGRRRSRTTVEATDVSEVVADRDFVVPST